MSVWANHLLRLAAVLFALASVMYFMPAKFGYAATDSAQRFGLPNKAMNNTRLDKLIRRIADKVDGEPGYWRFVLEEQMVSVITDERADRMRIVVAIAKADSLEREQLYRLMQSNFDTALDARYAVAKDVVWSVFIHPLAVLQDEEFLSGLGQTINLAKTYGSSYTSGALIFRGGDSEALQQRELIDRLLKKGLPI